MTANIDIQTQRLLVRRWQESDIEAFISMNASKEVMRYFPATQTAQETKAFYDRIVKEFAEYGFGLYAVQEKKSRDFMGFIGFHMARMDVDFCPCVEISWRLDAPHWGKGFSTEGAAACLAHGFKTLGLDEVISFTAAQNIPSQRVMQKIGMQFDRHFDHPKLAKGHPLRPHVLYRIRKKGSVL